MRALPVAIVALSLACAPAAPDPTAAPDGMVVVPGGTLSSGGVRVDVRSFFLDAGEVTNRDFAAFVAATSYVTDAERIGDSVVFRYGERAGGGAAGGAWDVIRGASWRAPEGPGSDIESRMDHPVVHVSYDDVLRYAAWAGKRLPTEAEWECARRSGDPADTPRHANLWQGRFPDLDRGEDGWRGTAPVKSYPADANGAFDLAGNVWEWVATTRREGPFRALHPVRAPGEEAGLDHQIRGGSFLCARGQCEGYRPDARQFKGRRDASNNVGFRLARDR